MKIKNLNKKGFTLIELLATIIILSLVMGISASGIMGVINQSKARGEKLFVSKLSKSIDDYINLKGSSMVQSGSAYAFDKKIILAIVLIGFQLIN